MAIKTAKGKKKNTGAKKKKSTNSGTSKANKYSHNGQSNDNKTNTGGYSKNRGKELKEEKKMMQENLAAISR